MFGKIWRGTWALLWLSMIAGILPVRAAAGVNYTFTRVAVDSSGVEASLDLSNSGQLVLGTYSIGEEDGRLYFYDGTSTLSFLHLGIASPEARINDCGQIVYQAHDWSLTETGAIEHRLFANGSSVKVSGEYGKYIAEINNSGQITWTIGDSKTVIDENGQESGLYGSLIFISDSNGVVETVLDRIPDYADDPQINDSGELAWLGGSTPDWVAVYLYRDGIVTEVWRAEGAENESAYDVRLNNRGQITWWGSDGTNDQIYLYDGVSTIQLTSNNYDNVNPQINNRGQVVWRGYDGNAWQIYLYSNGTITQITHDDAIKSKPQINDRGEIVWEEGDTGWEREIFLYSDGTVYQLTQAGDYDLGNFLLINNKGQIAFTTVTSEGGCEAYLASPDTMYSQYSFTYYYNNGSSDYYTGYFYAPTSFQTWLTAGTSLWYQPEPLWASGYVSLNGGYYYITGITDGFSSSYDKQSYITSYYDADTARALLGVSYITDSYSPASYVSDRTSVWESCYAINGSNQDTFDVYKEANVSATASPAAASSQAVWAVYWSQTPSLLEEER